MRSNRWVVLLCYTALAGISQMLWLNFAPIISQLETRYQASAADINWLLSVFPLIYVLLSVHAGMVIDRRGYRFAVGIGGIFMAVFACVRIMDFNFYWLLVGQIGIAIGQPYVVNGITKLVTDWFPRSKQAMATGIGTMGMFIGMALALAGTPILVEATNLQMTLLIFAAITVFFTVLFWIFVHPNPQGSQEQIDKRGQASGWRSMLPLLRDRQLLLICVIAFAALGFFNGLTSWLEQILAPYQVTSEEAGWIGGAFIIGGILGAGVIPAISDKIGKQRPFLQLCCLTALVLIYPLCTQGDVTILLVLSSLLGFFFLPGYAMLLSMTERIAGEKQAGEATGLMMLAGNLGGVIVIPAMQMVTGSSSTWINAVYLMLALVLASLLLTIGIKEKKQDVMQSNLPL
ncbi:MFS transporter [Paenibacillus sp. N1-5-1-14]|uniref:MFS transporter n=1 Tax=Paenibacillus radicibacter TaxID=2972488 RepID=UPI002158F801|nr:MFS transporter [Paenibacillus radicibacter]MCR8642673.1 MFS transporter [Paenibacillus radicibacter]